MGKVIIVISPDYLQAMCEEAEKYSFFIQGYGKFEKAAARLVYTNAIDILGFVYVAEDLPPRGSDEWKYMLRFLGLCNLMAIKRKFVIVIQNQIKTSVLTELKKFRHLNIVYNDNIEFITDTVINKNIFGSILLANYTPYQTEPVKEKSYNFDLPRLSYQPLVPPILFEVEEMVHVMQSTSETMEHDIVLNRHKGNKLITTLREIVILNRMGEDSQQQEQIAREEIAFLDAKLMGIYEAYLDGILKGGVMNAINS